MRRLITRMIEDVIAQSRRHIVEIEPAFGRRGAGGRPSDHRLLRRRWRRPTARSRVSSIHGFTATPASPASWATPSDWSADLFEHYVAAPGDLPAEWTEGLDPADAAGRALRVADFIAGMTDRYAMVEHARLFGSTPELR